MPRNHVPVLKEPIPKKRSARKVGIILVLLFITLLCVLFFRSSLSKISEITIEGNTFATKEEILQSSGLKTGAPFFGTSSEKISRKLSKIPSIQEVIVDKSFPGKVHITIKEHALSAYELTPDGELKGLLANGTKIELVNGLMPIEKPILTGWKSDDDNLAKLCAALAQIPDELISDISEITPSPTLSYSDRIKMYTRSRFEVISTISLLPRKAEYMNSILQSQDPGKLTLLDADSYVPYNQSGTETEEQNDTTHE